MTICPDCLGERRFDVSEPNPVGSRTPKLDWRDCQRCEGTGWVGEYHKTDRPDRRRRDMTTKEWLLQRLEEWEDLAYEDAALFGEELSEGTIDMFVNATLLVQQAPDEPKPK